MTQYGGKLPVIDIHWHGTKLGTVSGVVHRRAVFTVEELELPIELQGIDYGYVTISPERTLELGDKVKRVHKDVYIKATIGDFLRKYHDRFKQNAPMDLHEPLRQRAIDIVEELW